jgi:hypothetical protein
MAHSVFRPALYLSDMHYSIGLKRDHHSCLSQALDYPGLQYPDSYELDYLFKTLKLSFIEFRWQYRRMWILHWLL